MRNIDLLTTWRTPNLICPACGLQRVHTEGERTVFHPFSRHGFDRGMWTDPRLDPESVKARYLASLQQQAQANTVTQNALSIGPAVAYTPRAQATKRGNP